MPSIHAIYDIVIWYTSIVPWQDQNEWIMFRILRQTLTKTGTLSNVTQIAELEETTVS